MRRRGQGLRLDRMLAAAALPAMLALGGAWAPLSGQEPDAGPWFEGDVVDVITGRALPGVTIRLEPLAGTPGGARVVLSDEAGGFFVDALVPGTYAFTASHLGFAPVVDTLTLAADSRLDVWVRMSATPVEGDSLVVEVGARPVGPLMGFDQRRAIHRGTFFTREGIEASNAVEFTDLMRTVPGIRIVPAGAFGHRLVMRGCRPELWLDGTHVGTNVDLDSFLRPQDLEAVEVYRGSVIPAEFGTTQCGAVVAWSRRGAEDVRKGSSLKKQLLFAGSLVALFVLVRS